MPNTKKAPPICKKTGISNVLIVFLILTFVIVFTDFASASDNSDISSVSVEASATGDEVYVTSSSSVSDHEATGSATAISIASNGNTAVASASASAFFKGESSTANSFSSAVSNFGQTVYAEVKVFVSSSYNGGLAISEASAGIGMGDSTNIGGGSENYNDNTGGSNGGNHWSDDNTGSSSGNDDKNNAGNVNTDSIKPDGSNSRGSNSNKDLVIIPKNPRYEGMFGFDFGNSDPERYYCFKIAFENSSGPCIDVNNTYYSHARSSYNMQLILDDYGMNETQFETKFPKENYPIPLKIQDRV